MKLGVTFSSLEDEGWQTVGSVVFDTETQKMSSAGLPPRLVAMLKAGVIDGRTPETGRVIMKEGRAFLEALQWAFHGGFLKASSVHSVPEK